MTGRTVLATLVALTALLLPIPSGFAVDYNEFDKVIKTIPPNGPFWKYGTLMMYQKTMRAGMAPVVFPHWSHRARYTCRVCHLELEFSMRRGDSGITRAEYLAGRYCGTCHDGKTAFSAKEEGSCKKCHTRNTEELERKFEKFAESMPLSPFGNGIDWAKALRDGKIAPKNTLLGDRPAMKLPDQLKASLKLGTMSPRSDVLFSHEEHVAELDCSICHPEIFNVKKKGTQFSMEANIMGSYCGSCHMNVAFPMNHCQRCHPKISYSYTQ